MVTFVCVLSVLWAAFFMILDDFGGSGGTLEPSWVPGSIFSEKGSRITPKNSPKMEGSWSFFGALFRCSLLVAFRLQ